MLKLQAEPTFKATVVIPVPGIESAKRPKVLFTFKHMTRAEFEAFKQGDEEKDAETLMRICAGWDGVDGEFNAENFGRLLQAYPGSAYAIANAYALELYGNRLGN